MTKPLVVPGVRSTGLGAKPHCFQGFSARGGFRVYWVFTGLGSQGRRFAAKASGIMLMQKLIQPLRLKSVPSKGRRSSVYLNEPKAVCGTLWDIWVIRILVTCVMYRGQSGCHVGLHAGQGGTRQYRRSTALQAIAHCPFRSSCNARMKLNRKVDIIDGKLHRVFVHMISWP